MVKIRVYIDGLCQPKNPEGIACWAFCIYKGDTKLVERWGVVGEGKGMSNNLAEYVALREALRELIARNLYREDITVYSDSQLIVNQMEGIWRVKEGMYLQGYIEASRLVRKFIKINFVWIPREENVEVDTLSRKAYEEYCRTKGLEATYGCG